MGNSAHLLARAIVAATAALVLFLPAAPTSAQEAHSTAPGPVDDAELIDDTYQALLGRTPDDEGRQHWLSLMDQGMSQRELLAAVVGSAEHRHVLVGEAFRSFLGRAPEAEAVDWYVGVLARSTTATTVRAELIGSAEYYGRAGGSDPAWVDAVYRDVLGRGPDEQGRRYFLDRLAAGVSRQHLASVILESPEAAVATPLGIESAAPARRSSVTSLDAIELDLDRAVVAEAATVVVTIDGQRVDGTVSPGDFADTLVFEFADTATRAVAPGSVGAVAVTVVAHDGSGVGRADMGFSFERPVRSLSPGDSGPAVQDLQHSLAQRGWWVGPVDGQYGDLTQQAVYAFQKAHDMERTGVADPATLNVLSWSGRVQPRSTQGTVWEVDKARQLLIYAVDGRAVWVWNTSTGTEEPYTYEGRQLVADTPPGRWEVSWQVDGVRDGALGRLYRPKYFHADGIAVHGYPNVPPYPASHGCVRVTNAAIDWIWANDVMPIGADVWVY